MIASNFHKCQMEFRLINFAKPWLCDGLISDKMMGSYLLGRIWYEEFVQESQASDQQSQIQ
jgi:hypothetical protein